MNYMTWVKDIACRPAQHGLMAKKFPLQPKHPERICWGCDKYCPADALACGNGSGRTQHPIELLGPDWWLEWDMGEAATAPQQNGRPTQR